MLNVKQNQLRQLSLPGRRIRKESSIRRSRRITQSRTKWNTFAANRLLPHVSCRDIKVLSPGADRGKAVLFVSHTDVLQSSKDVVRSGLFGGLKPIFFFSFSRNFELQKRHFWVLWHAVIGIIEIWSPKQASAATAGEHFSSANGLIAERCEKCADPLPSVILIICEILMLQMIQWH